MDSVREIPSALKSPKEFRDELIVGKMGTLELYEGRGSILPPTDNNTHPFLGQKLPSLALNLENLPNRFKRWVGPLVHSRNI